MNKTYIKKLTRAAVIAAMYCALTLLFAPISFKAVQFRIAEALTLLPILTLDAVPGLFIGCLLANLFCGAAVFDVVFGSLATLLAAFFSYRLRRKRYLAAAMPVLFNGLIVGPVVYFCYEKAPEAALSSIALLFNMFTVALGEAAVCLTLGLLFIRRLEAFDKKHNVLN